MRFACDKDKMENDKESEKETRKRTKMANEKIMTQVTIMTSIN